MFNEHFTETENETAEEQAIGMLLAHIEDTYDIEVGIEPLKKKFLGIMEWLNEEVEECIV